MKKILLFAGTSEGRRLSERMEQEKIPACACVATEYGETLLPEGEFVRKMAGRLTEAEMEALMRREEFSQVVDATHPYAAVVSENIRAACLICVCSGRRRPRIRTAFRWIPWRRRCGFWKKPREMCSSCLLYTSRCV